MIGKRTREALYVHSSAWKELNLPLRRTIAKGVARLTLWFFSGEGGMAWFGKHADFEAVLLGGMSDLLVKLPHKEDSQRLSFLYYPNFDASPHPVLAKAALVDFAADKVQMRDYTNSRNPPILHRKEEFVAKSHPLYEQFAAVTKQEEAFGLYAKATLNTIGTRKGWEKVICTLPPAHLKKLARLMRKGAAQQTEPEPEPEKEPRYRYDCDNCKFSWCCGPLCSCVARRADLEPTPLKRMREVNRLVAAWRKKEL